MPPKLSPACPPRRCRRARMSVTSAAATAAIRRRSSVSAALRSMCRGMTRATIHSHQRGHLVTSKIWTIWVPAPAGSRVMRQSLLSTNSGVGMVRQAIWRGGSTARTSHVRLQRSQPARLRPRNRAPGAAAVAPPSQLTWRHSWLHSPVRVTSATTRHTDSTGASAITSARHVRATRRFAVFMSVPFLSRPEGKSRWSGPGSSRSMTSASQFSYCCGVQPRSSVSIW